LVFSSGAALSGRVAITDSVSAFRFATSFSWWSIFGKALQAGFSRASLADRKSPAEAGWGAGLHQNHQLKLVAKMNSGLHRPKETLQV
jgi:hypothetical protein